MAGSIRLILYNNLINNSYGEEQKRRAFIIDYNHKRNLLVIKARYNYAKLANALFSEGKNEKALSVLDIV